MGADNTLVDASFKLGASQAGVTAPNLKPLYEANALNMKKGLGMITGVMDKLQKEEDELMAGKEHASKRLKSAMDNGMKKIHALKEPLPEVIIQAIRGEIKALQEEFETVNTYGKGDTEENNNTRNRIEGELGRVINGAVEFRGGIGEVAQGKDNLDLTSIDYGNLDPMTMALDVENMDKNAANGDLTARVVGGKITLNVSNYSTRKKFGGMVPVGGEFLQDERYGDPMDWTMQSIKDKLAIKNTAFDTDELKWHNGVGKRVSQDFSDGVNSFNLAEEASQIAGEIKSESDFKNIAKRDIEGLGLNFKRGLLQSGTLQRGLMHAMFLDGEGGEMDMESIFDLLDADGDGDVDSNDENATEYTGGPNVGQRINKDMWLDNSRKMMNAITDTDAPGFDLGVSRELASQYFASMREQKYNSEYTKLGEARDKKLTKTAEANKPENIKGNYRIGGARGVYDPATGGYRKGLWKSNAQLDVDDQIQKMKNNEPFRDHLGNTYRMGMGGKITGMHSGGNKPIYIWDDKLNDGEGGYSKKPKSWTEKEVLDLMFGKGEHNLG